MELQISNKTADFIHPTPYQVWMKQVKGTSLETKIGPWKFAQYLHDHQAIELFYFRSERKEALKCRILSQTKVNELTRSLENAPWPSPLSWVSRLARHLLTQRLTTKPFKQSRH